jgi:uncharacterized protein YggL (DUF469 family)
MVPKDNVSEGKKMRIDEKSYLIFMVEGCYVKSVAVYIEGDESLKG